LAQGLPEGRKALVFVRRVASVKELQAKLEERYDEWLFGRLRSELPGLDGSLQRAFELYREEQRKKGRRFGSAVPADSGELEEGPAAEPLKREEPDTGGLDSFFAWFFRGDGPKEFSGADRSEPLVSGANVQRRFSQATSAYSTFFEDNYVARVLRVRPSGGLRADGPPVVLEALAAELGRPLESARADLIALAAECLPAGRDKRIGRLHQFVAVQAAGLKMLASLKGDLADEAAVALQLVDGSRSFGRAMACGADSGRPGPAPPVTFACSGSRSCAVSRSQRPLAWATVSWTCTYWWPRPWPTRSAGQSTTKRRAAARRSSVLTWTCWNGRWKPRTARPSPR
jgi:hypothetical protein